MSDWTVNNGNANFKIAHGKLAITVKDSVIVLNKEDAYFLKQLLTVDYFDRLFNA